MTSLVAIEGIPFQPERDHALAALVEKAGGQPRLYAGTAKDRDSIVALRDGEGHVTPPMWVTQAGDAVIEFLDCGDGRHADLHRGEPVLVVDDVFLSARSASAVVMKPSHRKRTVSPLASENPFRTCGDSDMGGMKNGVVSFLAARSPGG